MATTKIKYLGRLLTIEPASLGKLFEQKMTIDRVVQIPASADNGWQRSRGVSPEQCFWYDTDKSGKELFCCFGGYFAYVQKELARKGIDYEVEIGRESGLPEPSLEAVRGIAWRPRQIDVVTAVMAHPGGIIKCSTAFGKTFTCKQLCKIYPTAKIVIVVGSLDIAKSIYNDLRQSIPHVGFCGTGGQHPDRVTVCVAKSMHNAPADASLVLADEVHTMCTESVIKDLNRFHRAKMFGFTASPEGRSDGADGYLEAVFGPVLVDVPYQEAVSVGNVVQLEVHIVPVTAGPNVDGVKDDVYRNRAGIIRNVSRNYLIRDAANWLDKLYGPEAQGLIMVDKTEHAFVLGQLLPDFTIVHGPMDKDRQEELEDLGAIRAGQIVCAPKDRDRHREAFEKNQLKRVIATRIWEKGVDFRDLAWLVRADGLASTIAACQIPGRLSRLGKETEKTVGILVDFNDVFAKCMKYRSKKRIDFYRESGWPIHTKTFS